MRGLHLDQGTLKYRTDLTEPDKGQVRVRVLRAGICATDLALCRGYMGFRGIPGHEFVGVAESGRFAGRRVCGEINAACGVCPTCLRGLRRHCPHRSVLGILQHSGAFAEYLELPDANLHVVPDTVSTDAATFAEPLAAACQLKEQLDLQPGMRALVVGDGKLGLLCAAVLRLNGLEVSLAGRHPERVDFLPAGITVRPSWNPATAGASRFGEPLNYDLVVEATGSTDVLPSLLQAVAPCGTIVLKTTGETAYQIDLTALVVQEITLLGSRCGPFGPALQHLADRAIEVEKFVEARYPLESGIAAFEHAARSGSLKILIDVSADPT